MSYLCCYLLRHIPIALYYPGGKLTLSQRQNACEEESEDQTQLTNIELPTQEADTLQPPSTSVTDSDGHQSASERMRNPKLSTDSVDSGMGRNSSHNSSSKLLQQDDECAVGHYPNERLVQIEQSISELKESFSKALDDLADQVRSIKLQSVDSNGPSIAISESTDHKASSSSVLLESNTGEAEMEQDLNTPPDMQATASSQPEASSMDESEQRRKRHYSDSKMTRYRKSEIRNKLGSVVPKALSEQINVSTQVEILPYKTGSEVLQCT